MMYFYHTGGISAGQSSGHAGERGFIFKAAFSGTEFK
jgi:hypothetical protein